MATSSYRCSLLLVVAVAFFIRLNDEHIPSNTFNHLAITCKLLKCKNFHERKANNYNSYKGLYLLLILLSNDIHQNPGPCNQKVFPCGLCDAPVNWSDDGVCCDNCSIWHHASCMGLGAADYSHLNKSSVSWRCFKCDYTNLDSFTFHSYSVSDTSSNYYFPLSDASVNCDSLPSSSIDTTPRSQNTNSSRKLTSPSVNLSTNKAKSFSPLKTSTPETPAQQQSTESTLGTLNLEKLFSTTLSSPSRNFSVDSNPYEISEKKSLRVLNLNAQSIKGKLPELHSILKYVKPDIVCCTETWFHGKKPGQNHSKDAVLDSEITSVYKVFRNDRNSLGGGVLFLVSNSLIVTEQPELVTECEMNWIKIKLRSAKDLYIGCFYMPHRNNSDLSRLEASLDKLNHKSNKHFLLCGDFNCPDIDWAQCAVNPNADQRDVQQQLLDIASSHCLTQVVEEPTRQGNILDLCFTTNHSLVKGVSVIPGISDHDAVVIDSIIKPIYQQFKRRTVLRFNKADWCNLKQKCVKLSDEIQKLYSDNVDINSLWDSFKTSLNSAIKDHIPSKTVTFRNQVPWMSKDLKRLIKKKARLHKQAKKNK